MRTSAGLAAATALSALTACASAGAEPPRPASRFPYEDDLTWRGFAQEVLFGYGTQRTHLFDDYTDGSYHVRPAELITQLPGEAELYGLDLYAAVVVGPYGTLWAYDVITVVRQEDCLRVSWILMPHARITVKRSGCVEADRVDAFLSDLAALAPSVAVPSHNQDDHCLVVGQRLEDGFAIRQSHFGCYTGAQAEIDVLDGALDEITSGLELTYSGYPPGEG